MGRGVFFSIFFLGLGFRRAGNIPCITSITWQGSWELPGGWFKLRGGLGWLRSSVSSAFRFAFGMWLREFGLV